MRKIFIIYRRAEVPHAAGALGRELRRHFGEKQVFRDQEDMDAGVSWRQQVLTEIDRDSALLVLIGRDWVNARDAEGKRRLDKLDDPIRLEISDGIKDGAAVFPVLLENSLMPGQADLPPEIKAMADLTALKLRDSDWQHDFQKILTKLEKKGFKSILGAAGERSVHSGKIAKPFRLSPSFTSGLFGGLIGGALAGLFISMVYYLQFSSRDKSVTLAIIPQIFGYGLLSGALLSGFIQFFILWFRHLVTEKQYPALAFNEVSGGFLGGAVGGIPVGALAGLIFGALHENFPEPVSLVTGSVIGAISLAVGALFYDYRERWRNVIRAFVASLLITACAATAGILILQLLNFEVWFFSGAASTPMTQGGAVLGAVIGMVLGLQVGLTLTLYRLWPVTEQ